MVCPNLIGLKFKDQTNVKNMFMKQIAPGKYLHIKAPKQIFIQLSIL